MTRLIQLSIALFISSMSFAQLEWESRASLPNYGLDGVQAFSLDGKAYFGLGRQTGNVYSKKIWEYNPSTDIWTQKTSYPGNGALGCVSFVIGNKAYVGMGQSTTARYTDFYEYNQTTDDWTQKANFPGGELTAASTFTVGDTAYIVGGSCGGRTCYNDELWMYVPSTNAWTQRADFPGGNRAGLSTFTIGQYGYAGNGVSSSLSLSNNFWKYNPSTNTWTAITSMPGTNRRNTVSFVIDSFAYVGTGTFNWTPYVNQNDFYYYNPSTNGWTQRTSKANFIPRHVAAIAQVDDSTIFIGTGIAQYGKMPDLWQLKLGFDTCDYFDTTFVQDTTFIQDTTFLNDTITEVTFDTVLVYTIDTIYQTVYDTTFINSYDTITQVVYDTATIISYDTIYTTYTIAVEDTLIVNRYTDNCGNILHKIYPNPTKDYLYLSSNGPDCFEGYKVQFIDALGKILETKPYGNLVTFDIRGYARSLYFLRLIGPAGDAIFSEKIILD
jgi:N-acetylneuraminic acid mutarotase